MKSELEKEVKELRELKKKSDEIYKPVAHIYDELHSLGKEIDAKYRSIASHLGIEYCIHDRLTIEKLIEYLEK